MTLLRGLFRLGVDAPIGRYLGCVYEVEPVVKDGVTINNIHFNMSSYVKSCVDAYTTIVQDTITKKKLDPKSAGRLLSLPFAATPSLEANQEIPEEDGGILSDDAASIVMKIMFAARIARPDVLKTACHLSTFLTRWSPRQDLELRRLVCYLKHSADLVLTATIGDKFEDLELVTYVDSDYAGDYETYKSTSGSWTTLRGPRTDFPISYVSKKQTAVARSSTEAEVAAADVAIRKELLPLTVLLDEITDIPMPRSLHEDNTAAKCILTGSVSKELRHMARTHRISTAFLQEAVKSCHIAVNYVMSADNIADIFTKLFTCAEKWANGIGLLKMSIRTPAK